MSTNEENVPTAEHKTPSVSPGNYSPVTVYMEDSIGAIFLDIFAVIFLVNWRRAESRNHRLMEQLRG